jgi:hypothetical protein
MSKQRCPFVFWCITNGCLFLLNHNFLNTIAVQGTVADVAFKVWHHVPAVCKIQVGFAFHCELFNKQECV